MAKQSKTNILPNFIKTFSIIFELKPLYIVLTIVSIIINSLCPIFSLTIMQSILNFIQSSKINLKVIFFYVVIYISIDLFQTVLNAFVGYFCQKYSLDINLYIKKEVLKKSSSLSLKDYEESETYNIIQRAQNESDGKILTYFNLILNSFGTILTIFSYLIFLISFKKWMIFAVLTIPIMKYIVLKKINLKQFHIIIDRTDEERKTWYYSYIMSNGCYHKELKLYNLYEYFLSKFEKEKKKFIEQDIILAKESSRKITFLSIIEQIFDGIIFGYIIYYGYLGYILLGDVVSYTRAIIQTKSNVQTTLNNLAEIEKQSMYLEQLFILLAKKENAIKGEIKIDEIKTIQFINLSYKYSMSEKYILKNINLKLFKGQTYAILGKNGSGKTTLAKILMGFYDDYEGEIFINDLNMKTLEPKIFRNKIGALFQDFGRYESTIRENISYGNLEMFYEDDKIKSIIKKFDVASLLSDGNTLDTQLGYWFDSGKQISVGQWQKIALCRAFIRNADVYILDEPNASLDAISEFKISNLYQEVLKNRMGIIIAHKFGHFIETVDQIIVLNEGEIVEFGEHKDLIKAKGLYSQLYNLQ